VLLTAITSVQSDIHETNLLLSVRACFHIHLISKVEKNKMTAKTALTQILDFVTQRMELSEQSGQGAAEEKDVAVDADVSMEGDNTSIATAATVATSSEASEASDSVTTDSAAASPAQQTISEQQIKRMSTNPTAAGGFKSIHHKDSYLLFRALCKLSMKGHDGEAVGDDRTSAPIILQNKVVSFGFKFPLMFTVLLNFVFAITKGLLLKLFIIHP
jgi:brefeldin A-inhibited guanine nucleotide-exchange protein